MAEKGGKSNKPKIIKGTTSSGLKFQINSEIREDTRTLLYLTKMQKKTHDPLEQSAALFELLTLVFGQDVEIFMNEVAYRHGGVASTEALIAELKEIFDAAKLKNS